MNFSQLVKERKSAGGKAARQAAELVHGNSSVSCHTHCVGNTPNRDGGFLHAFLTTMVEK
jgi:hypothetical protein